MRFVSRTAAPLFLAVLFGSILFFSVPLEVGALGLDADAMCFPSRDYGCPCGVVCHKGGPPGGMNCLCSDNTSGFTTAGVCIAANKCQAKSTGGGPIGDISKLLEGISKLMEALKGKGGGGEGGSPSTPAGCTTYYQVSTPSSDPCAYYVPQTSTSLNGTSTNNTSGNSASDLLNALSGTNNTTNTTNTTNTGTSTTTNSTNSTTTPVRNSPSTVLFIKQQSVLSSTPPGVSGDIRITQNGATILVTNPNGPANSVTAGFLGTNSVGGAAPQGIVQGWCQNRPWASNFLSAIIPPTFFDGLCTVRGFQVGKPIIVAAPAVILTQTKTTTPAVKPVVKPVATTTATTTSVISGPAPEADIWAVPTAVALGSRATVFWNSKNAASCTITSPDGSFSHKTLSGGGATVPLAGASSGASWSNESF